MSVKVKICGIKTPEAAQAAIDDGADFLGFIFHPSSPRYITPEESKQFTNLEIAKVAVVVDADDELLEEIIANLNPDYIQLHGNETDERAKEIKDRFNIKLIRSRHPALVAGSGYVTSTVEKENQIAQQVRDDELYEYLLIDPSDGQGKTFDWDSFTPPQQQYFLSGGLTPDNIQEAIQKTGASLVDVSSGIESERGVKDLDLIKLFIEKVKTLE